MADGAQRSSHQPSKPVARRRAAAPAGQQQTTSIDVQVRRQPTLYICHVEQAAANDKCKGSEAEQFECARMTVRHCQNQIDIIIDEQPSATYHP